MSSIEAKFRLYGRLCANRFITYLPKLFVRQVLKSIEQQPRLQDQIRFHVQSYRYDSAIPTVYDVDRKKLIQRRQLPGIQLNDSNYLSLIKKLLPYAKEFAETPIHPTDNCDFWFHNGGFADYDAISYYAMVRHIKPKRVIEVGCGYSSKVLAKACAQNIKEGFPVECTFIEPYPQEPFLRNQPQGQFIQKCIQDVPLDFFSSLDSGDLLFIDTSHILKAQSDCCYELIEIIPSLKPGVYLHFHDIFTPYDYPEEWLFDLAYSFNEQYALECLLSENPHYEILLPLYFLFKEHREALRELLPDGETRPASFWLKKL